MIVTSRPAASNETAADRRAHSSHFLRLTLCLDTDPTPKNPLTPVS